MIHPCININSHGQQQINLQQLQYPSHFKSESSTMKSTFRFLSNHQHDVSFCHQNSPFLSPFLPPLKPKNCPRLCFGNPPSPDSKSLPENRSKCPRPDKQVTLKRWILWELSSGKQLPAWILGFTTFHRSVSHFSPVFSTIESHWTKVNPAWANGPERTYFTELLSLSIVCLKFTRAWTCVVGGVERTG